MYLPSSVQEYVEVDIADCREYLYTYIYIFPNLSYYLFVSNCGGESVIRREEGEEIERFIKGSVQKEQLLVKIEGPIRIR